MGSSAARCGGGLGSALCLYNSNSLSASSTPPVNTNMCNKVVLLLSVFLGAAAAQQGSPQQQVSIVKYEVVPNSGDGSYSFSYELSDGTARSEQGTLQNVGTPDEFMMVTGSYKHMTPEGIWVQVDYTADQDGYHPKVMLMGGGGGLSGSLVASLVG